MSDLIQPVSEQEWLRVQPERKGHADIAKGMRMLKDGTLVRLRLPCAASDQYTKRDAARTFARRHAMKLETKYAAGWLYLRRVGK